MIEWDLEDETLVVRKAGTYSLDDTRRALGFSTPPSRKSLRELKAGLGRYMRATHARR